jgi:hypothetical protein
LKYISSPEWQKILKKRAEKSKIPLTEEQKTSLASIVERDAQINTYYKTKFPEEIRVVEKIRYENGEKLAWPIQKTNQVKGIVIHHTDTEYADDMTSLQSIYKFHTVTRAWGDLGYNFLI